MSDLDNTHIKKRLRSIVSELVDIADCVSLQGEKGQAYAAIERSVRELSAAEESLRSYA